MSEHYTGFKQFEVESEVIDEIYKNLSIRVWDRRIGLYPNMYVELRSSTDEKKTAIGRVTNTGETIEKIKTPTASGIKPRNREQVFALDALLRDDIPVVILSGIAGTGKSILALAAALDKMQEHKYSKTILTKPMSEVTRYKLGALPGDASEKFNPYLLNYLTNLEQLVGNRNIVKDLIDQSNFEIVPIQLMRGASFNRCMVIVDEVQVLNHMEMLTIGTRIGEGSKIVIMGDLDQRDEKIAKDKTGMFKIINDRIMKESPLSAAIELQKCERSETAKLFSQVFSENNGKQQI